MIHFFPKFANDVADTPLALQLRRSGVPHRLFAAQVDRNYRSRAELLLRIYPALVFLAICQGLRSLLSRPTPAIVVVTSDVEAIIFGLLIRALFRPTRLVFETFIMTPRQGGLQRRLHGLYYRLVLSFVDAAICHSQAETLEYRQRFRGSATRFLFVPYGINVGNRAGLRARYADASARSDVIVAAGKSGRDYDTLAAAIEGLPCKLRVICDWEAPTESLDRPEQITVLRGCFGTDYLEELAQARLVVIPLKHSGTSAGQMVLLQAFALGKPVIITDTETTRDYVQDGRDAVVSGLGDIADLRRKIEDLWQDDARRQHLGETASARFEAIFSTEAYVSKLITTLRETRAVDLVPARAVEPVAVASV